MKTGCVFWEGEGRVMCFWSSVWVQATPQFSWGALPLPPTLPCPSRFGHVFSSVTWPMTESLWRWTSKPHPQRKNSHCASHVTLELWPLLFMLMRMYTCVNTLLHLIYCLEWWQNWDGHYWTPRYITDWGKEMKPPFFLILVSSFYFIWEKKE